MKFLMQFTILMWALFGSIASASYGPIPPVRLILDSNFVAVGEIFFKDGDLYFKVDKTYKSELPKNTDIRLVFPDYVPLFEKKILLGNIAKEISKKVVVLGDVLQSSEKTVVLRNSFFSIWPSGLNYWLDKFSVDECEEFINSILSYEKIKNSTESLINQLYLDILSEKFVPVVEYGRYGLQGSEFSQVDSLRYYILGTAFAEFLYTKKIKSDKYQKIFFDSADLLPQVIAIPWLFDLIHNESPLKNAAFSKLSANFKTRHLSDKDKIDIGELENIFNRNKKTFLEVDFKYALNMLDSEYGIVRDKSRILLGQLLGFSKKSIENNDIKYNLREFWQKELDNKYK